MEQENDVSILVADYGRSGQGWLSFMLCYILNARYIEPYLLLQGAKHHKSEHILKLTQGNLPGREKTKYSLVVKTHEYPWPGFDANLTDKIICLTRDPRDVAVSYYNMQVVNTRRYRSMKTAIKSILLNRRIIHYIRTAHKWKKYYQYWDTRQCYKVRYEDLINNLKETLQGILAYLGIEAPDKIIEEAMREFAFEKTSGRPRGQEDKNNLDFRKGIVGDHKNYFNRLELLIFRMICAKQAAKSGYVL
jgi:Sulfotransferase domain